MLSNDGFFALSVLLLAVGGLFAPPLSRISTSRPKRWLAYGVSGLAFMIWAWAGTSEVVYGELSNITALLLIPTGLWFGCLCVVDLIAKRYIMSVTMVSLMAGLMAVAGNTIGGLKPVQIVVELMFVVGIIITIIASAVKLIKDWRRARVAS